jgi:hypothetical protein
MAKQQIVDLLQNLQRGTLAPRVRRLIPPLLNAQIQEAGFGRGEGGRDGTWGAVREDFPE